jgi:predicted  nucleic acid-binding Zn-ribbon protein
MDFQDYAASEASALFGRLLANHAGTSLQQLEAVRNAIDAAVRTIEAAPQPEQDIDELVARLTAAAHDDVRRAGDESRRISEEARRAIDEADAALQKQLEENARLVAAVSRADAETALLKSEIETARERADSAERDFITTVEAHGELESALEAAATQTRQLAQAKAQLESELAAVRGTLDQATADVNHLRKSLARHEAERAEVERHLAAAHHVTVERDALARDIAAAADRGRLLESELESAHARIQTLEAELSAVNGRACALETELCSVANRTGALDAELSAAHGRTAALEGSIGTASGQIRRLESDLAAAVAAVERHDAVVTELEMSRARAQALDAERGEREEQMRQLQVRLDDALQAEARLRELAETKLREGAARALDAAATEADQSEALRWEVERMVSLFDASVRAVHEMASARSSADLMSELVKRLSLQFSRVALFRVKGVALEGELQVGFEETDVTKLILPITVDSLLTRAINSGAVESVTGASLAGRLGTPFGGTPTSAVALPIVMQGNAVAVVYADDADMPDSARGPAVHESGVAFARLLVGEAALLMMCHTQELKMLAELRQYATTLLQEAKKMYLADAEAGKAAPQLRARLKDNLECASQLYTYRAAMEGTAAAALLDEQIAAEIAGSTQFARDLAEVMRSLAETDLGITAEAS